MKTNKMDNRINKPRVFLSHSSLDKGFIKKLHADLLKCKIDSWLDTEEIRDGKPWLKVIFEDGIPTCDAVLVYFTDNSLKSKMVAKEVDATLVEELSDRGISLLPYVNSEDVRKKLRSDLQSLHCRVWNEKNYAEVLPSVVSEIWRLYWERVSKWALLEERNKRLELELKLQTLNEQQRDKSFSPSEERDFEYINTSLNVMVKVEILVSEWNASGTDYHNIGKDQFEFNKLDALVYYIKRGYDYFDNDQLIGDFARFLKDHGYPQDKTDKRKYVTETGECESNMVLELKTYGLVKSRYLDRSFGRYIYEFTDKMYRFIYWLGVNGFSPTELTYNYIGRS